MGQLHEGRSQAEAAAHAERAAGAPVRLLPGFGSGTLFYYVTRDGHLWGVELRHATQVRVRQQSRERKDGYYHVLRMDGKRTLLSPTRAVYEAWGVGEVRKRKPARRPRRTYPVEDVRVLVRSLQWGWVREYRLGDSRLFGHFATPHLYEMEVVVRPHVGT